jgi:hypothetical protein
MRPSQPGFATRPQQWLNASRLANYAAHEPARPAAGRGAQLLSTGSTLTGYDVSGTVLATALFG